MPNPVPTLVNPVKLVNSLKKPHATLHKENSAYAHESFTQLNYKTRPNPTIKKPNKLIRPDSRASWSDTRTASSMPGAPVISSLLRIKV